jgi:hypothetical protein
MGPIGLPDQVAALLIRVVDRDELMSGRLRPGADVAVDRGQPVWPHRQLLTRLKRIDRGRHVVEDRGRDRPTAAIDLLRLRMRPLHSLSSPSRLVGRGVGHGHGGLGSRIALARPLC